MVQSAMSVCPSACLTHTLCQNKAR